MLAKRYNEHEDTNAAHKLVTSHLRHAPRSPWAIAATACRSEVISEGNRPHAGGQKFEPERGPAGHLCHVVDQASIQEYILRSWSLVKMGTTANQKRLFFNLRKVKARFRRSATAASIPTGERDRRGSTSPRRRWFR